MDGVLCGLLTQTSGGDVRFTYDDDYRRKVDATPLSLSMPLALSEHRKRVVLPFLDGLIPDNEYARRAIAQRYGVSSKNPFALLSHTGSDVAGALQILQPGVLSDDGTVSPPGVDPLSNDAIGGYLRDAVDEYGSGRPSPGAEGRFSLSGAQPKIALTKMSDDTWGLPRGSTPTTHILKPITGEFRRVDVVEFMTMRAASVLGLNVASSSLMEFNGMRAFVTKRYDRMFEAGRWRRQHQEDLGQSLNTSPAKKYQRNDGGPGVADVAKLMRGLPLAQDRSPAARDFFEGLAFNVLVECTDAHIKNYSVLLSGASVSLAPLYDLATFAPYSTPGSTVYSAMHIAGEYRFSAIGETQLVKAAATLGVDATLAQETVHRVQRGAVGAFEIARDELAARDEETQEFATDVLGAVARLDSLNSES